MTRHRSSAILTLLAAAVAMARPAEAQVKSSEARPLREYGGLYFWAFEQSQFSACGADRGDGPWWVTLSDHALAQRDSALATLKQKPSFPLFVRWKGVAGDRGAVGHMGRYTRYFTAYELLELRPSRPDDCRGSSI